MNRDEWIIGEATASGRWYLVHAAKPRFLCELLESDAENVRLPGFVWVGEGYDLAHFDWLDAAPEGPTLAQLLKDGLAVAAAYDEAQSVGRGETTAQRVKAARQALAWTQAGLAVEADLHQSQIAAIESGREPTGETLAKLAEALGCRRRDLIGD